jgi:hypothetical protein
MMVPNSIRGSLLTMTSPFLINEETPYDAFPEWYAPTPG